eukprot:gb/GECH01003032.1/.p1 GENE.gb/GECH01003032.1/~~gb/GECH01003032.1/.p1  ORF type:complete len:368 (+),score=85.13 gb/GECH01003032.1/:1-1104(+)
MSKDLADNNNNNNDLQVNSDSIQLEEKMETCKQNNNDKRHSRRKSKKKYSKQRFRWVRCCFPFGNNCTNNEETMLNLTNPEQSNKYDGSATDSQSTSSCTYQSAGMSRLAVERQQQRRKRRNSSVEIFQEKNKNIVRYEDESGTHEEEIDEPETLIASVSRKGTTTTAPSSMMGQSLSSPQEYLLPFCSMSKKTLVLDLDETLVHSSFKPVAGADFIIPIYIDGVEHKVYVCKRPGVDQFIRDTAEKYELVIFTASLKKYADAVVDRLDPHGLVDCRLFREHCTIHNGNYVKDLARLGRELKHSIIIDNSPVSYYLQPENAIPITSWFDDPSDTELIDMIPFLSQIANADSVYSHLKNFARNSGIQS